MEAKGLSCSLMSGQRSQEEPSYPQKRIHMGFSWLLDSVWRGLYSPHLLETGVPRHLQFPQALKHPLLNAYHLLSRLKLLLSTSNLKHSLYPPPLFELRGISHICFVKQPRTRYRPNIHSGSHLAELVASVMRCLTPSRGVTEATLCPEQRPHVR